jgi:acetyl esterase
VLGDFDEEATMTLHEQAELFLTIRRKAAPPELTSLSPEDARELMEGMIKLIGAGPEVGSVREVSIPTGAASVAGRIYEPVVSSAQTIVYFHGGGWVVGSLDGSDAGCRRLTVASGARVVSVDYRLAPEHRFPTAVDDAYAALCWAAEELDCSAGLVVAGDSAGGNLAAACALRARDAARPSLDLQVLVYPVTDHDFERPSYVAHGDSGYPLGRAEMEWFFDHYVDVAVRDDPDASPLRAARVDGVAPALVLIAEYDPLRDEGIAYADRLRAEGVSVEVVTYDDMLHGFFTMVNFMVRADEAVDLVGERVRSLVAGGRS